MRRTLPRFAIALLGVAGFAIVAPAHANISCTDRTPAAITTVATAAEKCQEAIAKEGAKFLKLQMAALASCKLTEPAGTCPTTKASDKVQLAAVNAAQKIAAACGDDSAQAGLSSSYANSSDDAVISSCMLSQHNVDGELVVANATGATTEAWPVVSSKERGLCVKELSNSGQKFVTKALANINACLKKQMKHGAVGDLAPVCVGSFSGGAFVAPTDPATAKKQAKLVTLIGGKLTKQCAFVESTGLLQTIFGCPGATTVADLQQCAVCTGWTAVMDAVEQEYSERGHFVANGPGALQAAVTAASVGDKLLIGSGEYDEEVSVTKDNLSLVGCGGASDNRPLIKPPAVETSGDAISSSGVNGLLFQSISVFGQQNDGIRVVSGNDITFRDIIADGNGVTSYAVFPRTCNNVLIELCKARRGNDAPLYVGQSSGIVMRFNEVRESVSAMEIENCGNAQVYGNYATGNTGGLLVFKDGSLPIQLSQCHDVHHNLLENNNKTNTGMGTVAAVPVGTGILVVSDDTTLFHQNIARGNDSFGIALTDQVFAQFGPPFSADEAPEQNYFYQNVLTGNGANPDVAKTFGIGGDAVVITASDAVAGGNCQKNNTFGTELFFTNLPVCSLPPAPFATCPAPSVP